MKDIFGTVGKILGFIFMAGVIAFTGWMTMRLGQRLIPGDSIMQWMILILFDGAAVVWFVLFITQARGTVQWAIAAIGWLIGLAGAVIMTAGELVLGQQLVLIEDPTRFGWIIIATVVVAALSHAILSYLFHFSDPAVRNRIENAQKTAQAIETAYNAARQQIDNNVDTLTEGLVASAIHEAQQQINAITAYHVRNAHQLEAKAGEIIRGGAVVDGKVKDAPTKKRRWFFIRPAKKAPVQMNPFETVAPKVEPDPTAPRT